MAKFEYLNLMDSVTVAGFRGYVGMSQCNGKDEYDFRHGLYLALLRAMKGSMLDKNAFQIPVHHIGHVKNWKRITAQFIAYTAYQRGVYSSSRLNSVGVVVKSNGIGADDSLSGFSMQIVDSSHKSKSVIEDEFVRLHRAELDELITLEEVE